MKKAISFLGIMAAVFFAAYVASQPVTVQPAEENNEAQELLKVRYLQKESMRIFKEKFQLFASATLDCGANLSQKQTATKLWCENPK